MIAACRRRRSSSTSTQMKAESKKIISVLLKIEIGAYYLLGYVSV
jgi:hypothetical protein